MNLLLFRGDCLKRILKFLLIMLFGVILVSCNTNTVDSDIKDDDQTEEVEDNGVIKDEEVYP